MGYFIEEAKQLSNKVDILDVPSFFVECAQTEFKLFEGLIELDFVEVYNEAGIISLSEADVEKADETSDQAKNNFIKNIWHKFVEAIKNLLKKIKDKFKEFTKKLADKKIDKDQIIKSDKIKDLDHMDIWYEDYMNACDEYISKTRIESLIKNYKLKDENDVYKIDTLDLAFIKDTIDNIGASPEQLTIDKITNAICDMIDHVPMTVDQYNNRTTRLFGEIQDIKPVRLGDKKPDELVELKRELTLDGLTKRIEKCFSIFSKDESGRFKINKGDSPEMKSSKIKASMVITGARLAFFAIEIKICANTAKIARRNYSIIKAFVKGKIDNSSAPKVASSIEDDIQFGFDDDFEILSDDDVIIYPANESALTLAGIASDFICESIFEF